MKNTPHIRQLDRRNDSDPHTSRPGRNFPQTAQNYQSSQLVGTCGTPAKFHEPAFFKISSHYFAEEDQHNFALDTCVFGALMLPALFAIVNGVQAVATLIHSVGVL
jgi:hypothetical protein